MQFHFTVTTFFSKKDLKGASSLQSVFFENVNILKVIVGSGCWMFYEWC